MIFDKIRILSPKGGAGLEPEGFWKMFETTGDPVAYLLYQMLTEDAQDG